MESLPFREPFNGSLFTFFPTPKGKNSIVSVALSLPLFLFMQQGQWRLLLATTLFEMFGLSSRQALAFANTGKVLKHKL